MILRAATISDVPALQELIDLSVRGLSGGHYSAAQVDAAMDEIFGVDTQLIADGTYYVVDNSPNPIAAGGWSARRTLFGGDKMKQAEDPRLDPTLDAARIRAFFVHPDWARRGLARRPARGGDLRRREPRRAARPARAQGAARAAAHAATRAGR